MIVANDKYSNELNELLKFMEIQLVEELPTPTLTPEYFMLAILSQQKSLAYERLESLISHNTLEYMQDAYAKSIASKALTVIKPGREIKYDAKLIEILEGGLLESKKLFSEKETSEHIILYILASSSDYSKIRKILNKAGLTYSMLLEKMTKKESKDSITPESNETEIIKSAKEKAKDLVSSLLIGEVPSSVGARSRKTKANSKYPNIENFCSNLNELAENGKIDKLIGRENEIAQITRILGRRKKNNVILVGGEGVGKTAIGENLAYLIINKSVPDFLLEKKVISLDMTALVAGTTLRGQFEERVKGILDEIKTDKNFILFIDNIGDVLSDKGKNDYDISAMLSHSLENGEVQVIGTSDFASYRKVFDKDASLGRRFQKVIVEAPTVNESIDILNGLKGYYEEFHCVSYTDEAIKSCVNLANRYITERNLPDSAIDVMDEAGSLIGTSNRTNETIKELRKSLEEKKALMEEKKKEDNFEEADKIELETREILTKINEEQKKWNKERKENPTKIDDSVILTVVSSKTGIPVNKLTSDDKKKLTTINERLKEEVIGQDDAIDTICRSLKRNRIGLTDGKCMFSALMIGKTGTGKTLIAKKLAKEMFGDEKALIRFDMSEYPDKSAVNKLIGSNPGYIGYEEGGQLTEAIKNHKHCVLLLDEIEKADPEVYNIFLQVLDEGFLTDNSGMKVDFKNVIVIFTSNVGAKSASDFSKGIGFVDDADANSKRILLKELKKKFPPEFLNRLNSVIYFNNLSDENLKGIIKLEIGKLEKRLSNLGYKMKYDEGTIDKILSIVQDEREFGARPIMRAIQDNIEDKITDLLIENDYNKNYEFNITCFSNDEQISVS